MVPPIEEVQEISRCVLDKHIEYLRAELADWPLSCCGDTCTILHRDMRRALPPGGYFRQQMGQFHHDLTLSSRKRLGIRGTTTEEERTWLGHCWFRYGTYIIDPTAGQFLPQLTKDLLVIPVDSDLGRRFRLRQAHFFNACSAATLGA